MSAPAPPRWAAPARTPPAVSRWGVVGPRVAAFGDSRRHARDRLRVGIDRLELVPRKGGGHLRARTRAHAPRAEHRLVRRVLVEVHEDAPAALFLPPLGGDEIRMTPRELTRERDGRAPHLDRIPLR